MSAQRYEEDWQVQGSCRGPKAVVFFPPPRFERKHERLNRESEAKAICGQCVVREECLDFALSIREPHGIWGGFSEVERKSILAEREAP